MIVWTSARRQSPVDAYFGAILLTCRVSKIYRLTDKGAGMTTTWPTAQDSNAYLHFYRRGVQYYVAARHATMAHLAFVAGGLFHSAVEMLLKGQLSKTEPVDLFKRKYNHNLVKMWGAFKALLPQEDLSGFDDVINKLNPFFDGLRYPDETLRSGAEISIGWGTTPNVYSGPSQPPRYELSVPAIDNLIAKLFDLCGMRLQVYLGMLSEEAVRVLQKDNACWEEWFPQQPS
jgi:hypothetical protein